MMGEQVYAGKPGLDGSIDVGLLSNGIYLIKLSTADGDTFIKRLELLR
jgi:hypothetical protein